MRKSKPGLLAGKAVPGGSVPTSPSQPPISLSRLLRGAGCALLVLGLLAGCGAAAKTNSSSSTEVGSTEAAEPAQTTPLAGRSGTGAPDGQTVPAEVAPLPTPGLPAMSRITFALETTPAGEAVEPGFAFEAGTTQVHAVFDYENLSSDQTWRQVWYHNGTELLQTSQPWLEAASGTYDYLVEAGDTPLPAGQWALEFYIDGELLTAGSFTIEEEVEPEATAEATALPKVYLLVFTRWNGEKHDLYMADSNGAGEQFIIGRAAGPSWSLDGQYIFFYGEEGVDQQVINSRVYPLPGVTNGIIRLTATSLPASPAQLQLYQGHGWNDGTARWANVAPDGTMIAYDGDRGGGRRIYFLGTSANQQFRYEIIGEQPDWSPDSQKIVYRSGRNNQTGIWISNRTDSGHTLITNGGTDSFPAWSPGGQTIAFSRDVGGNVDIYTVSINGSDLQRLTDAPGHDTLPAYLPDGDIVFRSARGGSWGIWKMKGDGSDQVQIIANAPVGPEWSFSRLGVPR